MSSSFNLRLSLAGADEIRSWSQGAVATHRLLSDDEREFHPRGLFSESIFGPAATWTAPAEEPGPMGHIELPRPVFHPLFRRGPAGRAVRCLLGLPASRLNQILSGTLVIVTNAPESLLASGTLIATELYRSLADRPGTHLQVETQAEAIRWVLRRVDLDDAVRRAAGLRAADHGETLRLLGDFQRSGNRPEWLVLDAIPVLPAGLRPMPIRSQREDLNGLYVCVLYGCERIRGLEDRAAPQAVMMSAVRSLQRRVAELFRHPEGAIRRRIGSGTPTGGIPSSGRNASTCKRNPWIGEWPHSARLPLVPDPRLKWFQCGLPRTPETLKLGGRLRIETTTGRVFVNAVFPDSLPFVNNEFNAVLLNERLRAVAEQFGPLRAMRVLDDLQTVALAALTHSGSSVAHIDLAAPPHKREILDAARDRVGGAMKLFERGTITRAERYAHSLEAWIAAEEQVTSALRIRLPPAFASGAVDCESAKRISGLPGLTRDEQDNLRETPIVSSLAEGMGSGDYWLTAQSARRSRTTDLQSRRRANRLCRTLLLAMRGSRVTQFTRGTIEGIPKSLRSDRLAERNLGNVIVGRTSCETVRHPITGQAIVTAWEVISAPVAAELHRLGTPVLRIRSPSAGRGAARRGPAGGGGRGPGEG